MVNLFKNILNIMFIILIGLIILKPIKIILSLIGTKCCGSLQWYLN
jgi:hypothetical protein